MYLSLDMRIYKEREARWAKKTFTEFARGLHDEEITNENETGGQEKEREDEVKITLYPNGIPEKFGERMVTEMFNGSNEKNPKWHYRDAYDQFKKLYPRAANGHPENRWSTTHLSQQFAKKAYPVNTDENTKLPVHQTRYGCTSLEMQKMAFSPNDEITQEPTETDSLIGNTSSQLN